VTYTEFLLRCVLELELALTELMLMLDALLIEMGSGLYLVGELY
jgi:hypothetical protein